MLAWLHAVGIPLLILFIGAFTKKIIRATPLVRSDFYLGSSASLTALTTGLASVAQFLRADPKKVAVCLVVALAGYVITLVIHQEHEPRPDRPITGTGQFFLGIVANLVGFGSLAAILLLLK